MGQLQEMVRLLEGRLREVINRAPANAEEDSLLERFSEVSSLPIAMGEVVSQLQENFYVLSDSLRNADLV